MADKPYIQNEIEAAVKNVGIPEELKMEGFIKGQFMRDMRNLGNCMVVEECNDKPALEKVYSDMTQTAKLSLSEFVGRALKEQGEDQDTLTKLHGEITGTLPGKIEEAVLPIAERAKKFAASSQTSSAHNFTKR